MTEQEINDAIHQALEKRCFGVMKRGLWYRPLQAGYTNNPREAARYTLEEAKQHEAKRGDEDDVTVVPLPPSDYRNDLNEMRKAEMTLDWIPDDEYCQAVDYHDHLVFVCGRKTPTGNPFGYVCPICQEQIYDSQSIVHSDDGMCHDGCPKHDCYEWHLITATAAQRAEAFLRTIGKWKE